MKNELYEMVVDATKVMLDHNIPHAVFLYTDKFSAATTYSNCLPVSFSSCVKLFGEITKDKWTFESFNEMMEDVNLVMNFDSAHHVDDNKSFDINLEFEIFIKDKVTPIFKMLEDDKSSLNGFICYALSGTDVSNDQCGITISFAAKSELADESKGNPFKIIKAMLASNYNFKETDDTSKEIYKDYLRRAILSYGILHDKLDSPF